MELGDESLLWRIACEDSIFSAEDAEILIKRLESVLERLLESTADPAIEITNEGTKICGLPAFQTDRAEIIESSLVDAANISSSTDQWTDTEAVVRKILSDVSHVPENEINKQQTIFNLGLDSISAIKVSSLLRKQSLNLSVGEMLKAADIATIASVIDKKTIDISTVKEDCKDMLVKQLAHLRIDEIAESAGIDLNIVEKALPCGSGQVYMLSTWQNSGGVLFYPTFKFRSARTLDGPRLSKAWGILCKKSSILRTVFASTGDWKVPFLQFVLEENPNPVVLLSESPTEGQLKAARNKPPVTLAILPPKVDTAGVKHTEIFLSIHHALYDGVSLDVLIAELQMLYRNPSATIQTQPQFEDFLAYGLADPSRKARKAFWSTYLGRGENTLLPLKKTIPPPARKVQFTPSLISSMEHIKAAAKQHGISVQALFFAAYSRIHASLLSLLGVPNHDIIFGIYLANRSLPLDGLSTCAIPTVNLVPLRIRNTLQTPLQDMVQAVQRDLHAIGSAENSRVGLWEVFEWTGVKMDCFINFLTLPGERDGLVKESVERQDQWVKAKDFESDADSFISAPVSPGMQSSSNGNPNVVAKIYLVRPSLPYSLAFPKILYHFSPWFFHAANINLQDSIDIEAAVRPHGGGLDVGIWFPESMQGCEQLGSMMEGLRKELEAL